MVAWRQQEPKRQAMHAVDGGAREVIQAFYKTKRSLVNPDIAPSG